MENSPAPDSQPNTVLPDQDKVWIAREEYDRLRYAATASSTSTYQQPMTTSSDAGVVNEGQQGNDWLKLTLVTALGLVALLSFTTDWFSYLSIPLVIGFLIFGIVSLANTARKRKGSGQKTSGILKVALISLVVILALPVLGYVAMIALLIFFLSIGGGDVGS